MDGKKDQLRLDERARQHQGINSECKVDVVRGGGGGGGGTVLRKLIEPPHNIMIKTHNHGIDNSRRILRDESQE